jgi:hypothetical protein
MAAALPRSGRTKLPPTRTSNPAAAESTWAHENGEKKSTSAAGLRLADCRGSWTSRTARTCKGPHKGRKMEKTERYFFLKK